MLVNEVEHMLRRGRTIHIKALVSYFPPLILAPSEAECIPPLTRMQLCIQEGLEGEGF